jgi:hypothetical protein
MAPMAGGRAGLDVTAGVVEVANATIADVAEEVRIVQQLENERRIGARQMAQAQSWGLGDHDKRACWWLPVRKASAAALHPHRP